MKASLAGLAALVCFGSAVVAAEWPSAAQIELVEKRRASFPVARLVADVDWYEPREIVRGGRGAPIPVRAPAAATISSEALAAARTLAAQKDSYALIVWRDGAVELEHYWPGFTAASRFDTASMHKTVLALVVGAAVADGHIRSVEDPIGRYVKRLSPAKAAIPLRALLEMASGIQTPAATPDPASPYWQATFGDDLRAAIDRFPTPEGPGRTFAYANANSQYLGWAIEGATRERYAAYLSRRLWRPLGAGDARVWLDRDGGAARASCCLQATARDWLRVGRLLLDEGKAGRRQLVPAEWVRRVTAGSHLNPNFGWHIWRGSPYARERGYGAGVSATIAASEPFAAEDVVLLDGSGGQRVYVVPSKRMVVVRIGAARRDWDDAALPNILIRGAR
jgi:CubicO group peptidase (beta-lactamase class C family)